MNLSKSDRKIAFPLFWILLSALYCGIFTTLEFATLPISDVKSFFMVTIQWCIVATCTSGLLGLISLNRTVFAILFPVLNLISAVMAYYSVSIGIKLNAVSIEIAVVNSWTMWHTVITPALVTTISAALVISAGIVYVRYRYVRSAKRQKAFCAIAAIVMACIPAVAPSRVRNAVLARMPYSIYSAVTDYLYSNRQIQNIRHTFDNTPAEAHTTPPDVIIVLGESLRADHLPMNGYHRNTMPLFGADTATVSLPYVTTVATHTYTSVPHILTRADSLNPDIAYSEQSFISLFSKAGYRSAWFANQDISGSYTYFAHETDTIAYCNAARSVYTYDKWLDTELIEPVKKWLSQDSTKPSLAILHTIGSHWWYKSHYNDSPHNFMPDTPHKEIGYLSDEQIVNSYDNTILATDQFLSQLTGILSGRNAIIIFISDHGEALGESGAYLHDVEAVPVHHPACMVWYTPGYLTLFPSKIKTLRDNRLRHYSTDAIFHTAIDAAGISTPALMESKSIFYEP